MANEKAPTGSFFDRLQKINANLEKSNIKGKPYANVAERVKGFWALYEHGRIVTEIIEHDGASVTFRALVYDGDALIATGTAREVKSSVGVNSTSFYENAETSAVGRAIGFCGIGDVNIASAEEVALAISQQEAPATAPKREPKRAPARPLPPEPASRSTEPTAGEKLLGSVKATREDLQNLYKLACKVSQVNAETVNDAIKSAYHCAPEDITVEQLLDFRAKLEARQARQEAAKAAEQNKEDK